MTTPTPLPILMDVLDRADALSRAQILASVQALHTDHPPAVIEAAVDAHLAKLPSLTPPAKPYRFPWRRPLSEAALQKRLKRTQWLAWFRGGDESPNALDAMLLRTLPLGGVIGFLFSLWIAAPSI